MPKATHKKAEHCSEKNCTGSPFCKGMCWSHYIKDYRRRSSQGLLRANNASRRMAQIDNWDENKLKGYLESNHDRETVVTGKNLVSARYPAEYKKFDSGIEPVYTEKYFNNEKENKNQAYITDTVGSFGIEQRKYKRFKDL